MPANFVYGLPKGCSRVSLLSGHSFMFLPWRHKLRFGPELFVTQVWLSQSSSALEIWSMIMAVAVHHVLITFLVGGNGGGQFIGTRPLPPLHWSSYA
jgi:hypothetical protein